ncbi:MAG TPA: class I SAM-dependent methyltransferase [Polyangiaceae bacterium]|nr:class I SAM-dependent methyltransferase [Polyangiaceae bacterium]
MNLVVASSPTTGRLGLSGIKEKQRAMWSSGDFSVIGVTLQEVGETLCEAVDIVGGERVLDVACGNGNATLAAARRFARVTGLDYVPALLEGARRRAEAEGLQLALIEGDAEALPFEEDVFDAVVSTFGVMFAPDHERAAGEMLRVCRPGGRIGVACWTPRGFIGQMLRTVSRHVPPPAGVPSPALWGSEEHVQRLLGSASSLDFRLRHFHFRYESVEHFLRMFRDFYGPTNRAFEALDVTGQARLYAELEELVTRNNRAGSRGLVVAAEYLETIAIK